MTAYHAHTEWTKRHLFTRLMCCFIHSQDAREEVFIGQNYFIFIFLSLLLIRNVRNINLQRAKKGHLATAILTRKKRKTVKLETFNIKITLELLTPNKIERIFYVCFFLFKLCSYIFIPVDRVSIENAIHCHIIRFHFQ